ncbi:endonuclease/exonuclease/phosphatase family protein [Serratia bockelmannii]|uniref:Endonuclease/exonuclease/phosphatase family protein n=1 Tax=Serratia bockelmannii TaxID=2703793 RepID=A0ABT8LW61_9GAMM|nr:MULTISPECIES: endonuclease/exonuclease/phosphatase family protein [Serratia]ELY1862431.1 endonuclease/exonuclease/phosphatase family protein [Serratia marcescens]MDN6881543.1 endonuclease/exonuclease/phosphatase family protein [Serratia bockelmannii]MDP8772876.1 endonuclease/exonuclease/phosphatase family protein [Serratia marcescens]MDP8803281.1 endonuclease/exonuclease/phosphatase family protein [Serratia marcescens]HBH6886390.1 endonuclease/exonuclease/phosphatase family protein [Serrati
MDDIDSYNKEISFIWWNTSLSPVTRQDRSSDQEKEIALAMVAYFLTRLNADCVCLGEVSNNDIESISNVCAGLGYEIYNGVKPLGRTSFDTCVLFNKSKLRLLNGKEIGSMKGGSNLKVAQQMDFINLIDGTMLHVFLSHWPSRLWCDENGADRHYLGVRLRDAIDKLSTNQSLANIIVLGDFNDEPFDKSISDQLMATRDRFLAAKKRYLFYNPFWRHMCVNGVYSHDCNTPGHGGTYYYKNDNKNRWRTFDQILVSSAFLGHTEWYLKESGSRVIDMPGYIEYIVDSNFSFDHMPVMAVIERV